MDTTTLQPIATAPRNGSYILLAGPSGYIGTPLRFAAGRWDEDRKRTRRPNPWMTHSGDDFTDGGEAPTHWMPLPKIAETPERRGLADLSDPFDIELY